MRSQKTFHVVNNVPLILDQKMSNQEISRLAEMPKSFRWPPLFSQHCDPLYTGTQKLQVAPTIFSRQMGLVSSVQTPSVYLQRINHEVRTYRQTTNPMKQWQ
jgi:hypothetical protein